MEIINLKVGVLQTNCYIVVDDGQALVIDPGAQGGEIVGELESLDGVDVCCVALTHGHWDHIGAVPDVLAATGAPLYCHANDVSKLFDEHLAERLPLEVQQMFAAGRQAGIKPQLLADGDVLTVGSKAFTVIHTPGHTSGSICLHCLEEHVLFAGDTLFAGGRFGRTDFEDGSYDAMLDSLATKFVDVDDDTVVFSGHEGSSTMLRERELNEYLR